MPTSKGLSYSTMLLAAQRMDDRRVRARRPAATTSSCAPAQPAPHISATFLPALSSAASASRSASLGRTTGGLGRDPGRRPGPSVVLQRDVAGDDDHRDAALGDGDADRLVEDARQMVDVGDQLDVVRALGEQVLGMRRLEVLAADLRARDVGGDGQHRHAAALAVEQAVDQVQVARAAAAGADGELAGQVRLGAGGEGAGLLVPHVDPVDRLGAAQRIGEAVQRIAGDAVDASHAGGLQGLDDEVGAGASHGRDPPGVKDAGTLSEAGEELHEVLAEVVAEIAALLDQHRRQAERRDLSAPWHGSPRR